jgi:transcriptional regulator with XRE-family HTH domain
MNEDRKSRQHVGGRGVDGASGPVAVAFGRKIKSLRGDQTVRAFAKQLGVSHGYLCDIEQGKAKPSRALVQRIEELYDADGRLLGDYPGLLDEWDARNQARAERRRWLARQQQAREADDAARRSPAASAAGADARSDGYPEAAASSTPLAAVPSTKEAQANRRELAKAGVGALLAAGADRSRRLLRWAESPNVGPLTLDEFDERVAWLSEHATLVPVARLLDVADSHAADVSELLVDGRHSGVQRTHLELLAGQFAYFQGRFAFTLGNFTVAHTHLRVARHFGAQLDHHLLLASAADIQSTIAFYQGRFTKALEIAQQAQRYATEHTAARLAVDEAKAYGGLGAAYRRELREALDRAERQLPDVLAFEPGATSPFGSEMFLYHAGTACVRAGDERAAELAREAVREYEALAARQDPRSSFANLAAARLDVALALVQGERPDPKEAARLGIQAMAVPRELQQDQVKRRVNELLMLLLAVPAWWNLPVVKELNEVARTYRPLALPAPARRALNAS